MNRNEAISGLVNYALEKEMIQPEEKAWAVNGLLDILQLDAFSWEEGEKAELTELLDTLLDDAYERGVLEENSVVYRDLLDTKQMCIRDRCIITPLVKNTQLLTVTNILNILQQASPRMFLALGVSGLSLLTGTDLSVGRMVGMGMVTATIIMHKGINTGGVFVHVFDFSGIAPVPRAGLLYTSVCQRPCDHL